MEAFRNAMGRETHMAKHTRIAGYLIVGLLVFTLLVELF